MTRQIMGPQRWAIAMVLIGTCSAALAQGNAETISLWLANGGPDTEVARNCAFENPMIKQWYDMYRENESKPREQQNQTRRKTKYFNTMCDCAKRARTTRVQFGVPECSLSR